MRKCMPSNINLVKNPTDREVIRPRREPTLVILLNGCAGKRPSTYLHLYTYIRAALCRGRILQWAVLNTRPHN